MRSELNKDLDGFYTPVMEAIESIRKYISTGKK